GPEPDFGDLLEFPRDAYCHWGVYVGNGKVVHLTADAPDQGSVKKQLVTVVAEERPYRVNNKYDKRCAPRKPKEIVEAAENEVGDLKKYNVVGNNCEHFATMMRYGKAFSDQVTGVVTAVIAGSGKIASSSSGPGLSGLFTSMSSSSSSTKSS
uniref:LRAT domain-containing protein n=1 Tax=Leptobrachium leishanense TaxID=445787 RepID=A0A8C5R401_9ANUR